MATEDVPIPTPAAVEPTSFFDANNLKVEEGGFATRISTGDRVGIVSVESDGAGGFRADIQKGNSDGTITATADVDDSDLKYAPAPVPVFL